MANYKNIRAVVGEYTTKSGEHKTQWATIGKLFIKDDGRMSIKLEMLPLSGWDGNAIVCDPIEDGQQQQQPVQKSAPSNDGSLPF